MDRGIGTFDVSGCVPWSEAGTSGDKVRDSFCVSNNWESLVYAWRDLEAAIATR
jgi:hypothetical protein